MKISTLLVLIRNVKIQSFKQGEIIIHKGSTKNDLYFVRKGLVRCYSEAVNAEDEEITFQLFAENHAFGNVHSLVFDEPSNFIFQALERTKTYSIEHRFLLEITRGNPDLLEIKLGKRMFKLAFKRLDSFVFLSPEKRYLKYVEDYPTIVNRAPDKYIANVLGITPTSLSRIRKRIATKKR